MSALLFFDAQRFEKALIDHKLLDNKPPHDKPITIFRDAIQAANTHFDNRTHQ